MSATLLASAARILWRLLERHGVDPEHVFREAGLDPNNLHDARARYADAKARAAWALAARYPHRTPDPDGRRELCVGVASGRVKQRMRRKGFARVKPEFAP